MNTDKKGFLEELRSLSEPVKHKIFLITAAASMILIVYLWLAYFNTIVPNAAQTAGQTSAAASTSNGGEGGAFGLFADAASSFWQTIGNGARGIVREMSNPKKYNISPR